MSSPEYVYVVMDPKNHQAALICATEEVADEWCELSKDIYGKRFTIIKVLVEIEPPSPILVARAHSRKARQTVENTSFVKLRLEDE